MKKSNHERDVMIKYAALARKMTILGLILGFWCIIFSHCSVLFGFVSRTITNITDKPDRILPVQTVYLYDITATHRYYLTMLSQIITAYMGGLAFVSSDSMFVVVLLHADGQFQILSNRIQLMVEKKSPHFQIALKIQVDHHYRLIRYNNLLFN